VHKYVSTQKAHYRLNLTWVQNRPIRCAIFFFDRVSPRRVYAYTHPISTTTFVYGSAFAYSRRLRWATAVFLKPPLSATHLFFSKDKNRLAPPLCLSFAAFGLAF
jgi:predicted ATPase